VRCAPTTTTPAAATTPEEAPMYTLILPDGTTLRFADVDDLIEYLTTGRVE
jgi:hypothetical protein